MIFKYGYIILYIITLTVALFNYKKYSHSLQLKLWLYFLGYSFITEITAKLFNYRFNIRAFEIYNTWWIVNSFFYLLFFLNKIYIRKKRIIIIAFISIILLYLTVSVLFFKDFSSEYLVDTWLVGQLFVVLTIMMYYTELLMSDAVLNIRYSLFFWISIGALIFNIGVLPVFVIGELIKFQGIFNYIILILNIILSLCFITGFIMSKKEFNQ